MVFNWLLTSEKIFLRKGCFDLLDDVYMHMQYCSYIWLIQKGQLNLRQDERQFSSCFHLFFLFRLFFAEISVSIHFFSDIRMAVATFLNGAMLHLPALQMHEVTQFVTQRHQEWICFAHVVLEPA